MKPLYRNSRAGRVRFLQVLFWAATLGFAALAIAGYANGPDPNSWVVGAILAPLFCCCAFGMEWYLRRYVTALDAAPNGLRLETLSTLGRADDLVPWADVEIGDERRELSYGGDGPSIDNASFLIQVRGRKLLVIDTTTDRIDKAALISMRRKALKE